ncbi:MAG: rhomboid family intramembrane serine protease [Caldilineaceae bacterium]
MNEPQYSSPRRPLDDRLSDDDMDDDASLDASARGLPLTARFYLKIAPPTLTYALLGINLAVFVAMILYGWFQYGVWDGTEDGRVLQVFGMKINALIANGQEWRLFTAMFLHIGAFHLLFNLYALYALGPMVEGYFGHWRFAAIYILGGLGGSVASYAFSANPSAGASGAIFGLAGATTVYFLKYRENFGQRGRAILQNMIVVIAVNLIFGLSTRGIDNWGHIGGLIGGAIVAWGLLPRYARPAIISLEPQPVPQEQRTMWEMGWTIFCVALLVLSLQAAHNIAIY